MPLIPAIPGSRGVADSLKAGGRVVAPGATTDIGLENRTSTTIQHVRFRWSVNASEWK